VGFYVIITDGGNWAVNNLTVGRNGSTIEGFTDNLLVTLGNVTLEFIYNGSTWQFTITTGAQGPTGPGGPSGPTGAAGAATQINATDTTSAGTFYPVFVAAAGSNQTARIRSTATAFSFNPSTGEVSAVDFNSVSDAQHKTNIVDIENSLQLLNQLRPVQFDWKNINKTSFGLIAQEVEQVVPHMVTESNTGKTLSYIQLIPLLIHTIQQMATRIESLEDKINQTKH
jgi:hypothetical protein